MNEWMNAYVSNPGWLPRESCLNLQYKSILNGNKGREITYSQFKFNFKLPFKLQDYFTEITNLLRFTINV
jgi:hypothetical protein